MRVIGLAAALIIICSACDHKPTAAAPSLVGSTGQSAPPPRIETPNLDELYAIASSIPDDQLMLTAYLAPSTAGITLIDPPSPDERDKLIAWLESTQPLVERAIALSKKDLEPFPPEPEIETSTEHFLRASALVRTQRVNGVLLADAARMHDAGDAAGALARAAAVARFAAALVNQGQHTVGLGMAARAANRLAAIADDKPDAWKTVDPSVAADVRSAFAPFLVHDPAEQAARWENDARGIVAFCRERFAVDGGAAAYADHLELFGVHTNAPAGPVDAMLERDGFPPVDVMFPYKNYADKARRLSKTRITAAIDDAEGRIAAIAEAIKAEDQAKVMELYTDASKDPTQIARVILGSSGVTLPFALRAQSTMSRASAKFDLLPR
jgi:hypothetical protein